jgi:hypothetical protein
VNSDPKVRNGAKRFKAGDVLKVEVSMSDSRIKFFCNNELQGEGRGVQKSMVPFIALQDMGDQATLLSVSNSTLEM